jgi:hypothetical protein
MEWSILLTLGHIIGVVLGVGGASTSDALFFWSLKDKKLSQDELNLLHAAGRVVWTGLIIAFLTGTGFIIRQYALTGAVAYIQMPHFQLKMIIITFIFLNGLVFHLKILPIFKQLIDKPLTHDVMKPYIPLLAISGPLSLVSWYTVLTLGITRGMGLPFWYMATIYLFLLAGGMATAYALFSLIIFRPSSKTAPGDEAVGEDSAYES